MDDILHVLELFQMVSSDFLLVTKNLLNFHSNFFLERDPKGILRQRNVDQLFTTIEKTA